MSESDLKLRTRDQERQGVHDLGRRVAPLQTAHAAGMAAEISNLMWGGDAERPATPMSRAQALTLLDAARVCVIGMAADGTIFFFNREAERTLGYMRADVEGRNYFELFLPRDGGASCRDVGEHVAACLEARDYESAIVAKGGRRLHVRWSSAPVRAGLMRGDAARARSIFLFGQDVTDEERRTREQRVVAQIAALAGQALSFEDSFDAVQLHLAELVEFDAAALVRYEATVGELEPVLVSGPRTTAGRLSWPLGAEGAVPVEGTAVGAAIATGQAYVCRRSGAGKLATDRIAAANGLGSYVVVPLVVGGEPLGALLVAASRAGAFGEREVCLIETIGPHLAAAFNDHLLHTQLNETRARGRALFERTQDGVLVLDAELRCVEANAAACRMLVGDGKSPVGRPCPELLDPQDPVPLRRKLEALTTAQACPLGEFVLRGGQEPAVEVEARAVRAGSQAVFVLMTDVTERNHLRRQCEGGAREMGWLMRRSREGVALVGRGRLEYVNPALVELFGYKAADALEGRPVGVLYAPGEGKRLRQAKGRVPSRHEFRGLRRGGATFPVEARAATFECEGERTTLLVLRDLSGRRELDSYLGQLERAQHVAGVAELAAGVAHDFNGLLVTILGGTTILRSLAAGDPRHLPLLGRIRDAATQATELTSRLLGYTQGGRRAVEPVSLNQVASDTLGLLAGCLPHKVRTTCDFSPELPLVEGDPHELTQVVLQAVLNAVEAMPDGGRLTIKTDAFAARDALACEGTPACSSAPACTSKADPQRPELRPGRYVRVVVSDTGCGMTPEAQRLVGEPFFTTKRGGRGLGMATAREIVARHNGLLALESFPGEGTTVEVLLPTPLAAPQGKEGT
jgi:PAS domain S-box-containing protein